MLIELLIVLVLTLVNGVLAMSELALVSSRPARLKTMADSGSRGAAIAIRLAENPARFLSSVQIGITLVGVLAGAFSGATLGVRAADALAGLGLRQAVAQTLGVGGVVVAITYLSLVFGELVPKQIALRAPEASAVRIAPLLQVIATVFAPVVWLLERSIRLVLVLIGQSNPADRGMTDAEVRQVLSDAQSAGVMERAETEMIAGVMRIADRTARGLMTPRREVDIVDIDASPEEIAQRFRETRRSRLPVRDGGDDEIVGVFFARDFLGNAPAADTRDPRSLLHPLPVIRDGLAALDVIEALRKSSAHMLLVYDEYGHFEGIVTPMNLLESIAGDFSDEPGAEAKVIEREDGSLLVSGWMPADEFADRIGITLPEDRDYETVAGLVLERMGQLPPLGASFEQSGWRIEVIDLDGRRIDKLLVSRAA